MSPDRREVSTNIDVAAQIEIPRDKRGRIRWSILKKDPQQLILVIEHQATQFIQEAGGITQRLLADKKRNDLSVAIGRFYPGRLTQLQIDLGLDPSKKINGYWQSPDNILREAREFLTTHETISQRLLTASGNSSLGVAMNMNYPGGPRELRKALGIEAPRRQNQFWNEETIEQEARKFYEEHDGLSSPLLMSEGRNDLSIAISRKFPGRWPALYVRLGLKPTQKENGYWTEERIEQTAKVFLEQHGSLSLEKLRKAEQGDLGRAIYHHYPDKMSGLKRQLGITPRNIKRHIEGPVKERGYWKNPENIEQEVRELLEQGGTLTYESATKYGKATLLNAVSQYYPGGLTALKEKLGLIEARQQVISPDDANEQLRRLLEV